MTARLLAVLAAVLAVAAMCLGCQEHPSLVNPDAPVRRLGALGLLIPLSQITFVANPSAPALTITGGAAGSYTYVYVARDGANNTTAAGANGSTSAGPTTLGVSNYIVIGPAPAATGSNVGAVSYDVYRTAGGPTQGKIGNVAPGANLTDNGLAADGTTAPAANSTGVGYQMQSPDSYLASVSVEGTFTVTLQLQGSIAGTTWFNEGSAVTTPTVVQIQKRYAKLRMTQTAYTSGTPLVYYYGQATGP